MKLLHTGDLHLDSPFRGDGAVGSDVRRESQRKVLCRVFALAKAEQCDLILIAGDLFDTRYVTPETETLLRRLLSESACPVVIAPGNHDPYTEGSLYKKGGFGDHVYIFSSQELQCFELGELGVRVLGYAFTSPFLGNSPLNGATLPEKEGYFHLLCAHADLTSPISRTAPVTEGDILRAGIDYAALGHIHRPPVIKGSTIRYCGIPQGRSFDETGDGGVLLVTLREGEKPAIEWRQISEERYLAEELALDSFADAEQVRETIGNLTARLGATAGTHLRLHLTGMVSEELIKEVLANTNSMKNGLASLELQDLTIPYADGEYLSRDVTLRGALYRALYPKLIDGDPALRRRALRALRIGLSAIDGRSIPTEEEQA